MSNSLNWLDLLRRERSSVRVRRMGWVMVHNFVELGQVLPLTRDSDFVISASTLMATKYYPGCISFAAAHAVSMTRVTRVIIGAADHEVHTFDVELRSLEDGKAMFDIELGDIEHDLSPERAQIIAAILQHE